MAEKRNDKIHLQQSLPGLENFRIDIKELKNGGKSQETRDRVMGTTGEILVWLVEHEPVFSESCEQKHAELNNTINKVQNKTQSYPLSILLPVWLAAGTVIVTGGALIAGVVGVI